MAQSVLREKLRTGKFFVVPGVQDMIAALLANKVGFDVVFGSGYWLTASSLGIPDVGIATYTQMLERMSTLVKVSDGAVIADADTGYGGLLNVDTTVRGYEDAGVTAIQLEDQEFPKRCGHFPQKRIVPVQDMVDRIRVASEARDDRENFQIIARTDAYQSEGIDGVLRRLEAYEKAGADILFPEALASEDDMSVCCTKFETPVMVNMANTGSAPVPGAAVLAEIGFAFSIYPSLTSLVAAKAMEAALMDLRENGNGEPSELFSFREFGTLIGFDEVHAFERKFARE